MNHTPLIPFPGMAAMNEIVGERSIYNKPPTPPGFDRGGQLTSREVFILSYIVEATEAGDMAKAEDFDDLTVCLGLRAYGLVRRAFTFRRNCFKDTKEGRAIWNEFRAEQELNGREPRS